ncbi:hypothetical protein C8R34_102176 [Nitrosomonas sp. Nm84]|uniref:hypothetical protein n=1 Tax=Nitrosomonas sp. Nm84 TaxID=200124 RepID=UPI000D76B5F0|nr:hypothetical protein [Nitrosomonas sp. Nm84]PXW90858.1 hypothetical protein C8R34_102176 [Nitrosomonas sp. Nm84]
MFNFFQVNSFKENSPARGLLFYLLFSHMQFAYAAKNLERMSLEQLMNIRIIGASKHEQNQQKAAATVSAITCADIRTYGWHTLNEALTSLPKVHTTYDYRYEYTGEGYLVCRGISTRVFRFW